MAEVCRLENHKVENKLANSQEENFCVLNVLCVFISLVTILADLTTDVLVFAEYCNAGYWYWALPTLLLIFAPNIITNIFSIRWYVKDSNVKSNVRHWVTHIFLVGILERYIIFLHKVLSCNMFESTQTQKLVIQQNDLSLLHFLHVFTGTVPQVILQSYAVIVMNDNYHTKVFALTASIASVICGCSNYIYSIGAFYNQNINWKSLLSKYIWHFSMLLGRISSILLCTICFGLWSLIPLALHWTAMTFWIITQKTTFCHNKLEETLYNVVMGFVYYFCYINLKEGSTRYRLIIFYSLTVTENFGSLFLYYLFSNYDQQNKTWSMVATVFVIGGTMIGIFSMILYYRYFHFNGPIQWKKSNNELELNNKTDIEHVSSNKDVVEKKSDNLRSFKQIQKEKDDIKTRETISAQSEISKNDTHNADKKFLLDHWIARSGTPTFSSVPIGNNSMDVSSIEFYTVENTPQTTLSMDALDECGNLKRVLNNYKDRKICLPTELNLKLSSIDSLESSIDEITSNNLNLQKRRGICSSDELRNDLPNINIDIVNRNYIKNIKTDHCSEISQDTDGSNKKTSSDSIDMDLDLSFSDINSSDINTFNENIVQKLCLSALKNIKVGNQDADIENIQRIALDILKEMYTKKGKCLLNVDTFVSKQRDLDTPTEILSVHDYENICAVNIAREAWGLRSWNGYSDIENWLHDGSVVRDRRRDTLTSGSSEISSCLSQELKNAILSASPFPKKSPTYSNVFVRFERTSQEDYVNAAMCHPNDDTFLAKPCVADVLKDPNHLEPIMEELDDLGDKDQPIKKRLNSESSLVATIDEIRKVTVNNSPKNVSVRRNHIWDSPLLETHDKIDSHLKRALWKEPSKFDSSNIMISYPEKENVSYGFKFENPKPSPIESMRDDRHYTEMCSFYNQNTKLPQSSVGNTAKHKNNKTEQNAQDLSSKNIDLLWQIVSENSIPHSSVEDLASNRISSSLQSLIQKDSTPNDTADNTTKTINTKKGSRSRPRRKFSILREKFEPRININSDEEILCRQSESTSFHPDVIVNVKNKFETLDKQHTINNRLDVKNFNRAK
ncbi:hypothetical protein evm_001640 [Chilo suppressalis]|nr:hypothetical protein evm_001640 [Chilo suppressalis]